MVVTQAWRYGYFWSVSTELKNKTPAQIQTTVNSKSATNVGSLNFNSVTASGAPSSSWQSQTLMLQPTSAYIDPMYANQSEGYWFGQQSFIFSSSMTPSGWRTVYTSATAYTMYFEICCRINALQDNNGGASSRHWVWYVLSIKPTL